MKHDRLIILILIMIISIALIMIISTFGYSKQEKIEEKPYIKYIITTYNGGKEIEKFEVYSNMQGYCSKHLVKVYDSPKKEILLFYSTLKYKIKQIER